MLLESKYIYHTCKSKVPGCILEFQGLKQPNGRDLGIIEMSLTKFLPYF